MDVFLMIRRKKTTLFLDCKESTNILELKKMIKGILKKGIEDIRLLKDGQVLEDNRLLIDVGFTNMTAKAQSPATIGLVFKQDDGSFENLEISDLSTPPDLPDVMKPLESAAAHSID